MFDKQTRKDIADMIDQISSLQAQMANAQNAIMALQNCLGAPTYNFTARVRCVPWLQPMSCSIMDRFSKLEERLRLELHEEPSNIEYRRKGKEE